MVALPEGISLETELLTGLKKSLYERSRFLDPTQMLQMVEQLKEWVGEELSFEEGATTSLGRLISELGAVNFVDQIPPLLNNFERLASAYFVRRGSVSGFHSFCNAWRDRLVRTTLRLAEEGLELNDMGRPPVPYAILVSGIAGRREQTLEDASRYYLVWDGEYPQYFEQFAYRILAILDQCSLVGRNASDFLGKVLWRGSLTRWDRWLIGAPDSAAEEPARRLEILADLRIMAGDQGVAQRALGKARTALESAAESDAFRGMAHRAVTAPLALTFWGGVRLEQVGERVGSFNVNALGLRPLVLLLRLLAVEHRLVDPAPTTRRITDLGALGVLDEDTVQRLLDACRLFTAKKIGSEIALEPSYVDPEALTAAERKALKAGLQSVRKLQIAVRRAFLGRKKSYGGALRRVAEVSPA